MKCSNCGNEIPDDSNFCEFCGTQFTKINSNTPEKKSSKPIGIVFLIIFLIIFIWVSIILAYFLYEKSYENSNLRYRVSTQERIISGVSEHYAPFVIYDVEIANIDEDSNYETYYGEKIYSKNSMYLCPKIGYIGLKSGSYKLDVKIYQPDGTLSRGTESPKYSTYSETKYFYDGASHSLPLTSWGNKNKGYWSKGKYRIEIWYNSKRMYSKSFTIY